MFRFGGMHNTCDCVEQVVTVLLVLPLCYNSGLDYVSHNDMLPFNPSTGSVSGFQHHFLDVLFERDNVQGPNPHGSLSLSLAGWFVLAVVSGCWSGLCLLHNMFFFGGGGQLPGVLGAVSSMVMAPKKELREWQERTTESLEFSAVYTFVRGGRAGIWWVAFKTFVASIFHPSSDMSSSR